jgi:hypothetical protein
VIEIQKLSAVLAGLRKNHPATQDQIHKLQSELNISLPSEYVDFALVSNGADGPWERSGICRCGGLMK